MLKGIIICNEANNEILYKKGIEEASEILVAINETLSYLGDTKTVKIRSKDGSDLFIVKKKINNFLMFLICTKSSDLINYKMEIEGIEKYIKRFLSDEKARDVLPLLLEDLNKYTSIFFTRKVAVFPKLVSTSRSSTSIGEIGIVSLCDGNHSLREIAEATKMTVRELMEILGEYARRDQITFLIKPLR